MTLLLNAKFAFVVLVVALGVWAATLAPWAPLNSRTVVAEKLVVQNTGNKANVMNSASFSLAARAARLHLVAVPNAGQRKLPADFQSDIGWTLLPPSEQATQAESGALSLKPPSYSADVGDVRAGSVGGSGPYVLRVGGSGSTPFTLVATLSQSRDYVGFIPVWVIIGVLGIGYIVVCDRLARKSPWPPIIIGRSHEHF